MIDLNTPQGCRHFIIDRRYSCRVVLKTVDRATDINQRDRRAIRLFRETDNPILKRRADVLEKRIRERNHLMESINQNLLEWGRELMELSLHIDHHLSQGEILDLLNVNTADRHQVSPEDGVIEVAYVRGLEDSAMYRDCDLKQGPLARAITRFMQHELLHNDELQKSATDYLFGKGGMLEFAPMYQQNENGEMVRVPPPLRLADECDALTTGGAA